MNNRILIVDISVYRESIAKMFLETGYEVHICDSAFDAMSKLKAYDYDLIVSEVELPGDNAFDLYNYISKHYPYIPTIMTTEKNIDTFFDRIFIEGIGNVLCKPVKRVEFLNLAGKLISKSQIFGLDKYMSTIDEMKKIRITSSAQIQKAIDAAIAQVVAWGFRVEDRMILNLVLNEMTINAVYHSHGYTKEKELRIPVKLQKNEFVDIYFAKNETAYGFSINDYNGILTKHTILSSINNVIEQSNLLLRAAETGEDINDFIADTGRGIDLVRKLCGEYYFIIRKGVRTEIMLIFERLVTHDDENYSSLKIIEDLT
jgi:CheY-like chemotaxis protein